MRVCMALEPLFCSGDDATLQLRLLGLPFDLGRMANLRLVDKRGKELVELKLQVLA